MRHEKKKKRCIHCHSLFCLYSVAMIMPTASSAQAEAASGDVSAISNCLCPPTERQLHLLHAIYQKAASQELPPSSSICCTLCLMTFLPIFWKGLPLMTAIRTTLRILKMVGQVPSIQRLIPVVFVEASCQSHDHIPDRKQNLWAVSYMIPMLWPFCQLRCSLNSVRRQGTRQCIKHSLSI